MYPVIVQVIENNARRASIKNLKAASIWILHLWGKCPSFETELFTYSSAEKELL